MRGALGAQCAGLWERNARGFRGAVRGTLGAQCAGEQHVVLEVHVLHQVLLKLV